MDTKKAELLNDLSASLVPPRTLHQEKHEQFTPIEDVNLHHLFSDV